MIIIKSVVIMFPAKHLKYLIPVRDAVLGKTLELRYLKPMVKKKFLNLFTYTHVVTVKR